MHAVPERHVVAGAAPEDGLVGQCEARLAVIAVIVGSLPFLCAEVPDETRIATAPTVATNLVTER